jgi:hypothetical protein
MEPDNLVFPAYHGGLWRPSRATAIVGHVARKHGLKPGWITGVIRMRSC